MPDDLTGAATAPVLFFGKDFSQETMTLAVRIVLYLLWLAALGALAWHLPFLFELPLIGAIAGAYWLFFRKSDRGVPD